MSLSGGQGVDFLSGSGTLNGGTGNDFLEGGAGDATINGDAGEDTMIGLGGNDTFDGGDGFDTILVLGTSGADVIDLDQQSGTTLVYTVLDQLGGMNPQTDTLVSGTVEAVRIEAGSGADTIRVTTDDDLFDDAGLSLRIDVIGGDGFAQDRLAIVDEDVDDLVLYRRGQDDSTGTVTVGPANTESFLTTFEAIERVQFIDENDAALNAGAGDDARLIVMEHDPNEFNDDRFVATPIGAVGTANFRGNIDPGAITNPLFSLPGDSDFFRIEATQTGTLDFQVFFEEVGNLNSGRPGLPGDGNLDIFVFDIDGTQIAGAGTFGGAGTGADVDGDMFDENERIRIPAVAGQVYYLQVVGAAGDAINDYSVSVVNEAVETPGDIELADNVVILNGDQVVTPVTTGAGGIVNFEYNGTANTFDLDLFVSGIELTDVDPNLPELSGATLNVAAAGANGAVIVDLGTGGFVNEPGGIRLTATSVAFPAANVADLLAGNTYFNITTSANAGGEIRGQINIQDVLGVTDSGRSQSDNITNDNTPTIFLRLDDAALLNDVPGNEQGVGGALPPVEIISIPHNTNTVDTPVDQAAGYRVAIFDETDTHSPVLMGFAQPVANLNGVYSFTFNDALTDGSHFLTARVQILDPADNDTNGGTATRATGFGERSAALEIVVDTQEPNVTFGVQADPNDGLHPDSDTGVITMPMTLDDNITSDTTPTFFGIAEADTVVSLYVDTDGDDILDPQVDFYIGETVAIPLDGTDVFPNGQWELTSVADMNDQDLLDALVAGGQLAAGDRDGERTILAVAEDVAGNVSSPNEVFRIFIDTQGPVVDAVYITSTPNYDLFDPKPSTDGATPRTDSISIDFIDPPDRSTNFQHDALKEDIALAEGQYVLIGDANGIIPIDEITITQTIVSNVAMATIDLSFFEPLPDDRYTLTIVDNITDIVGNVLDGESDAAEPQELPSIGIQDDGLVSGDGLAGGDFVGRFTIDSRPEIAIIGQGSIAVDINGNHHFDPTNTDDTNQDFVFQFGIETDVIFAGRFTESDAVSEDRFDRLGAYGRLNGVYRWLLDTDNDGVPDNGGSSAGVTSLLQINGVPIAGDFDPTHPGEEIGLFDGTTWYLDTSDAAGIDSVDNNIGSTDTTFTGNLRGRPVVGDFDGDGLDDLGTYLAESNLFLFDLANDGLDGNADQLIDFEDEVTAFGLPGRLERPVAGDFNLDGIDDIGLRVPNQEGDTPAEESEWYIFISDAALASPGSVAAINHPFSPDPLGNDLFFQFGGNLGLPLVGNFDPPVSSSGGGSTGGTSGSTVNLLSFDLDANLVVGFGDIAVIAGLFGQSVTNNTEAAKADFDGSGVVGFGDVTMFVQHFGRQFLALNATSENTGSVSGSILTQETADTTAAAAVTELEQNGLDSSAIDVLNNVDIVVVSLPDTKLGLTSGNTVFIDDDAAGYGWSLTTADDGFDLLSVLIHEFGHVLGFDHSDDGVLHEVIDSDAELVLTPETVDELFGEFHLLTESIEEH